MRSLTCSVGIIQGFCAKHLGGTACGGAKTRRANGLVLWSAERSFEPEGEGALTRYEVSILFCILAFILGCVFGYWAFTPGKDLNQEKERQPYRIIPPHQEPKPCDHCRMTLEEFVAYRRHR